MKKSATLSAFIEASHIDGALIRAVVRQMGGWQAFKESADDVADHGANGGFSGFIYYADTVPFFKRNKAEIITLAKDQADDLGTDYLTMIASFCCLMCGVDAVADALHNPRTEDPEQVRNALAWYALEEVARSYSDN